MIWRELRSWLNTLPWIRCWKWTFLFDSSFGSLLNDASLCVLKKIHPCGFHVFSCLKVLSLFSCFPFLFLCCCFWCRSTSNRVWAEDSTEKDKDSVPTALTVPVAPAVVNAAAATTTLTTTTAGTVSSTSEVRERRRCVKVLTGPLLRLASWSELSVCFCF